MRSCVGAPDVRMLATSREALRVPGEHDLPDPAAAGARRAAASAGGAGAVDRGAPVRRARTAAQARLRADRARGAGGGRDLVARLDGIPLALELAAARVRSLSVGRHQRAAERPLQAADRRQPHVRCSASRRCARWSTGRYDLLSEHEQTRAAAARRSSPAASTWRRPRRSAAPIRSTPMDVLDLLASLVEKSLVMLEERERRARATGCWRRSATTRARSWRRRDDVAATGRAPLRALLRRGQAGTRRH